VPFERVLRRADHGGGAISLRNEQHGRVGLAVARSRGAPRARRKEGAAAAVEPGGTLWFVFIGHGAPVKIADGNEGVLIGADTQQDADSLGSISTATPTAA
jgi:hypothetical protein